MFYLVRYGYWKNWIWCLPNDLIKLKGNSQSRSPFGSLSSWDFIVQNIYRNFVKFSHRCRIIKLSDHRGMFLTSQLTLASFASAGITSQYCAFVRTHLIEDAKYLDLNLWNCAVYTKFNYLRCGSFNIIQFSCFLSY